jgi:malate dehydrogenase (oxaloacetate-decarboxylating)
VSESVPDAEPTLPAGIPPVVIGDEEVFTAHVGGTFSVQLKAPLDTQRAPSIA